MATNISTEITRLTNAKAAIKSAIEAKGVTVGDGTLDTYAEKIGEISSGGGSSDKKYVRILNLYLAPSNALTYNLSNGANYLIEGSLGSSRTNVINLKMKKVSFDEPAAFIEQKIELPSDNYTVEFTNTYLNNPGDTNLSDVINEDAPYVGLTFLSDKHLTQDNFTYVSSKYPGACYSYTLSDFLERSQDLEVGYLQTTNVTVLVVWNLDKVV